MEPIYEPLEPIYEPLDPINDPSLTEKQKARIQRILTERKAKKEAEAERALATSLPKALATSLTKDIIMSVAIIGHGCEDFSKPLTEDLADYYRKNVRVYSRACVPGIISVGNILKNEEIIHDVRGRFSRDSKLGTEYVINKYIEKTKPDYLNTVRSYRDRISNASSVKAADDQFLQRSSGLSTFLFEKEFGFYEDTPDEKLSPLIKPKYPTIGVHVVNVSMKITNHDGSVHYEPLFDPSNKMFERFDLTMFNLIYKDGVQQLFKEFYKNPELTQLLTKLDKSANQKLVKDALVKDAQTCLGFGRKTRVSTLSLKHLYDFFQLLGVRYVNIMDYSCRSCAVNMNQSIFENVYRIEQGYAGDKRGLFGGKKRSTKKRSANRNTYKRRK